MEAKKDVAARGREPGIFIDSGKGRGCVSPVRNRDRNMGGENGMRQGSEEGEKSSGNPLLWRVGTLVVILLLVGFSLFRLRFDERIISMLPESDPEVAKFIFAVENIPMADAFYVDIEAASSSEADLAAAVEAADALYAEFQASDYFTGIVYRFSPDRFLKLYNTVTGHAGLLAGPAELARIRELISPESLKVRMARTRRTLLGPGGSLAAGSLLADPIGMDEILMEKLKSADERYKGVRVREGRIWSGDGRHLLMIATPAFPASETARGEALIRFANGARLRAAGNGASEGPLISFAGAHVATFDNASVIQKDVKRALWVLSLSIFLMGLLFFRNRTYVLLLFLPTGFSLAAASAVMGLLGTKVSAVAFGCGSVLAGITVDFGVHLLYMMDNVPPKERPDACGRLVFPLGMGAATTVSAFLCLTLSALPGQRQMGLFAALAVSCAGLFSIFLLKRCIAMDRPVHRSPLIPLTDLCGRFLSLSGRRGGLVLVPAILAAAFCIAGIGDFRFEGELSRLNGLSPAVKADFDRVMETWGDFSPSLVIVRGDTLEAALEKNDRLFGVLTVLEADRKIRTFSGVSGMLPARETQAANLERWRAFWDFAEQNGFRRNLLASAASLGFSEDAFDPFFRRLDKAPEPMGPEAYGDTAVSGLVDSKILTRANGEHLVLTTFYPASSGVGEEVSQRVEQAIPGALVLDRGRFAAHCASLVQKEFGKIAVVAGAAILACLYFFLRRKTLVAAVILPVAVSLPATLGALGHLGISVNLISMLFIVFIFGVGVDFSIFLLNSFLSKDEEDGLRAVTCGAVVICALTTTGGFATLVFARHQALFSIGAAGLIGMIACLGSALVFIPAAGRVLEERNPGGIGYGSKFFK